jgi:hypothetical protein
MRPFFLLPGLAVAAGGFLAMRNPMLFAMLAPGEEGHYQRMVLDPFRRFGLRMLG